MLCDTAGWIVFLAFCNYSIWFLLSLNSECSDARIAHCSLNVPEGWWKRVCLRIQIVICFWNRLKLKAFILMLNVPAKGPYWWVIMPICFHQLKASELLVEGLSQYDTDTTWQGYYRADLPSEEPKKYSEHSQCCNLFTGIQAPQHNLPPKRTSSPK